MADSFFTELKRRNVFKVGVAYLAGSWLTVEVVGTLLSAFGLEESVIRLVIIILAIGLIPVLILSWIFEITPEGIKRESEIAPEDSIAAHTGQKLNFIIIGLLVIALGYFIYESRFTTEPEKAVVTENVSEEPVVIEDVKEEPLQEIEKPSIAVLPFVNMSPDPNQEYFSDGLADTLLHKLAQLQNLHVIARTSSFVFKGSKSEDIPAIGKKLNVKTILEGSVQKSGNKLRITAQLINVSDGSHIWSKQFNRLDEDIFTIHDEIATEVTQALKVSLLGDEEVRLTNRDTNNLEAYTSFLLAIEQHQINSYLSLSKAVEHFKKAIELDPVYALAYVELAGTYIGMFTTGMITKEEMLNEANTALNRAFEINKELGNAYRVSGILKMLQNNFTDAEINFQRAIQLTPNESLLLTWYSRFLLDQNQLQQALSTIERGLTIDPLHIGLNKWASHIYSANGKYSKALSIAKRMIEHKPSELMGLWTEYYLQTNVYGRLDKSVKIIKRTTNIDSEDVEEAGFIAINYISLGDDKTAEIWVNKALTKNSQHATSQLSKILIDDFHNQSVAKRAENALNSFDPRFGSSILFLRMLRDRDMKNGNYSDAINRYYKFIPQLSKDSEIVGVLAFTQKDVAHSAIDLAAVFIESGDKSQADKLFKRVINYINQFNRLGAWGYGITDVEMYTLQGKKQQALSALKEAVDEGWRYNWWWFTEKNSNLASIHNEPEYRAIIAKIKADMAQQLKNLEAETVQ